MVGRRFFWAELMFPHKVGDTIHSFVEDVRWVSIVFKGATDKLLLL